MFCQDWSEHAWDNVSTFPNERPVPCRGMVSGDCDAAKPKEFDHLPLQGQLRHGVCVFSIGPNRDSVFVTDSTIISRNFRPVAVCQISGLPHNQMSR